MLMPILNNAIGQAISAVVGWFTSITTSTGYIAMIMTFIAITVIYRLLLKPLIGGSAGSDSVGRKSSYEDSVKQMPAYKINPDKYYMQR